MRSKECGLRGSQRTKLTKLWALPRGLNAWNGVAFLVWHACVLTNDKQMVSCALTYMERQCFVVVFSAVEGMVVAICDVH